MAEQPSQPNSTSSRSVDIRSYIAIVRRYAWFTVLVVAIALVATFLLTQRQDRVYVSSADVLLRTNATVSLFPYSNTGPGELFRRPENEQIFVENSDFTGPAREQSPAGVSVSVRASGNNLIFTARGTVPADIAAAANIWAEFYVAEQQKSFEARIQGDIDFLEETLSELGARRDTLRSEIVELEELLTRTTDNDQSARILLQKVSIETLLQPQLAPIDEQISSFRRELAGLESLTRFLDEADASARLERAARVPSTPISPNVTRNLAVGALMGMALGVAIPYLRHVITDKVDDREDAEETTQLPILGTIPRFKHGNEPTIEVLDRPSSISSERYRNVLTAIEFASVGEPISSVLFTSATAGAGKTTTAINIASLASKYMNVILVDADMRRPNIHDYVDVPNKVGLSDVLAGAADFADARQVFERDGSNFDVLPAGPVGRDPALLLRGDAWPKLLAELFLYDLIVIDGPPVLSVTDAVLAGRAVDGQILLSRSGVTTRHDLAEASALLASNGSRSLGVVVNQERASGSRYSYYGEHTPQD